MIQMLLVTQVKNTGERRLSFTVTRETDVLHVSVYQPQSDRLCRRVPTCLLEFRRFRAHIKLHGLEKSINWALPFRAIKRYSIVFGLAPEMFLLNDVGRCGLR